ncbi:MAG: TonB-dependent receptor plug domain-containing protein [Treponema sp.]|nr:TonB-dependent receptor plug domain-containing protein [Treponema sp.]
MDSDLNLPLEGAVIRTRDGYEYVSGRDGKSVIEIPDNRPVVIQASYPGYDIGVITIPVTGNLFTISLHLSGILQGRELIIEAARPGSSETRTGRSIAVGEREIAQTGEIGIIEDVMSTIKLLPGVSYTGFLDAQPSIRGGHPGDMSASLNGFYINNPFFWGSTFSIFDPRMVQSAQLSHGVFSVRYGHTISGLLEITSKNPSPEETQFELSVNTSAANFNLSIPLFGNGGILIMGRITYYDPVLALAGALSDLIPELALVKSFSTVPYIRTLTANGNYRFKNNLELTSTAFFGMDGVGITFNNSSIVNNFLNSETTIDFDFTNYQAFFTSSLSWNPLPNMLLKFLAGTGFEKQVNYGNINFNISEKYFSLNFINRYPSLHSILLQLDKDHYSFSNRGFMNQTESNFNLQGRADFDWEFSERLLLSAGIQVMFNHFFTSGIQEITNEMSYKSLERDPISQSVMKYYILSSWPSLTDVMLNDFMIGMPISQPLNPENNLLSTSAYILGEYIFNNSLNIELGLRLDHFLLTGKNNFSLKSNPVLNPRLNLEYNLLNNEGFFQKIDMSFGTGLFSSINDNVFFAESAYKISEIKPNRSWTSVIGAKFEFPESINLNIEAYFKYVFNRMYIPMEVDIQTEVDITKYNIKPKFDGEGIVWGIDLLLQKLQSRYWDGWLSYSFSYAKYRDPHGRLAAEGISGGNRGSGWYFPSFHRFHTLNFILNIKPVQSINIYFRLGIASGVPLLRRSEEGPVSKPVYLTEENKIIEKYYWNSYLDEKNRTTPSLNMDLKFSIFGGNKTGKTRYEVYIAVENVLGLLYTAQGNTSFNQYTGEIDQGSFSASYDIPIPIPSFGVKISY